MTNLLTIVAALLATTAPPVQTQQFSELEIDAFLPALVTGMKANLPDAYSVRDLIVCSPHKVDVKNGQLTGFAAELAFNAKSETGGYAGLTPYVAAFKSGRVKMLFASGLSGKEGFDGLYNRSIIKRVGKCRQIPQATVQALLDSTPAF